MSLLSSVIRTVTRKSKEPPSKLEYLSMMDALSVEIRYCLAKVSECRRKKLVNQTVYWQDKWNELMMIHMEYEWGLHPKNPERVEFN